MNFPSHRKVSKAFEEALQDVKRHASNGAAEGRRIDRGPGGVKMVCMTLYKLASVPHLGNCISTYQYVIEQCLQPYSISRSSSSQLSSGTANIILNTPLSIPDIENNVCSASSGSCLVNVMN